MDEPTTFPLFLTEEEAEWLINNGAPSEIWHKLNNLLSIMKHGEPCCDEI